MLGPTTLTTANRRRSPSTTVSPTASTTMAIRSQTTRSSYPPRLAGPPFSGASPSGGRWYPANLQAASWG